MSYHNYRHFRGTILRNAITVGLGSQLIAVPVLWAQTAGAAQTMDRVQITGSLIPTAETVGVAPVDTVDAERIALTGQQDILAVLRRYSTSFAGSGNAGQTENNGGFGEANVALRNLSTLVLLDGRRLANSSFSSGTAVDLNTLPLAAEDFEAAARLCLTQAPPLRAGDALHLALCQRLNLQLASFDRGLCKAAAHHQVAHEQLLI
jgi:hypothetical protein